MEMIRLDRLGEKEYKGWRKVGSQRLTCTARRNFIELCEISGGETRPNRIMT